MESKARARANAIEVVDLTGASASLSASSKGEGKTPRRRLESSDSDVVVVESAPRAETTTATTGGEIPEVDARVSEPAEASTAAKTETEPVVRASSTPDKTAEPSPEETPEVTPATERAANETPGSARTSAETAADADEEAPAAAPAARERKFCRDMRRALESKKEEVRAMAESVRRRPQGEMTDEGVRRTVAAALKEAKAVWRREEREWAGAVVKAQQASSSRRGSDASDSGRSASVREEPSMMLPFWQGIRSEESNSSRTTTVATVVASSASDENKQAHKKHDGWQFDQKSRRSTVPCIRLAEAKGVPPYKYFAYTTHCNSYVDADNSARLLFADDDGELLESEPVDERAEKDEDFTRLEEFQLCSVAARFSHIALPEDGHKPRHSLIDETAKCLKLEKERVV